MIEKKLGCKFIRIDHDAADYSINKAINLVHKYITKSTKKLTEESTKNFLIDELSNKLLGLEFKKDNSIKTKCLPFVVK